MIFEAFGYIPKFLREQKLAKRERKVCEENARRAAAEAQAVINEWRSKDAAQRSQPPVSWESKP